MASDLISRERLLDALGVAFKATDPKGEKQLGYLNARLIARKIPSVDAVEVVRCKDCAHAGVIMNPSAAKRFDGAMNCTLCRGDDGYGIYNTSIVYPDDYCSDGVRREGNAVD